MRNSPVLQDKCRCCLSLTAISNIQSMTAMKYLIFMSCTDIGMNYSITKGFEYLEYFEGVAANLVAASLFPDDMQAEM
jgi:hypothetical protein